jgi:hypothetical protein
MKSQNTAVFIGTAMNYRKTQLLLVKNYSVNRENEAAGRGVQ